MAIRIKNVITGTWARAPKVLATKLQGRMKTITTAGKKEAVTREVLIQFWPTVKVSVPTKRTKRKRLTLVVSVITSAEEATHEGREGVGKNKEVNNSASAM